MPDTAIAPRAVHVGLGRRSFHFRRPAAINRLGRHTAKRARCQTDYSYSQALRDSIRSNFFYAMSGSSKPFVVHRNKLIVPKERHIERVPPAYSVLEFRDDSQGRYWYVVAALEVKSIEDRVGREKPNKP